MNSMVKQIYTDLKGEILLFNGRENYNVEEQQLMVSTLAKRIESDMDYSALSYSKYDKIIRIIYQLQESNQLNTDIGTILYELEKIKNSPLERKEEELEYGSYFGHVKYGYPWSETYDYVITHRLMDVREISEAFEYNRALVDYNNNINFLITNNMLLRRYPNFYNEESLGQLKEIAKYRKSKKFDNCRSYFEFKRAANITLKNIDLLERKNKTKEKKMLNNEKK